MPFWLFLLRGSSKYMSYIEQQMDKARKSIHSIIVKLLNIQNKGSIFRAVKENKGRYIRITDNFSTKVFKDKQVCNNT